MEGVELAQKVYSELGTNDVFEISRKSNITIVYEKWFPVTLGEFDKKNKRITVNQNAELSIEKIIAHELGHYFLGEIEPQRRRDAEFFDEEKVCDDFADELTKDL